MAGEEKRYPTRASRRRKECVDLDVCVPVASGTYGNTAGASFTDLSAYNTHGPIKEIDVWSSSTSNINKLSTVFGDGTAVPHGAANGTSEGFYDLDDLDNDKIRRVVVYADSTAVHGLLFVADYTQSPFFGSLGGSFDWSDGTVEMNNGLKYHLGYMTGTASTSGVGLLNSVTFNWMTEDCLKAEECSYHRERKRRLLKKRLRKTAASSESSNTTGRSKTSSEASNTTGGGKKIMTGKKRKTASDTDGKEQEIEVKPKTASETDAGTNGKEEENINEDEEQGVKPKKQDARKKKKNGKKSSVKE